MFLWNHTQKAIAFIHVCTCSLAKLTANPVNLGFAVSMVNHAYIMTQTCRWTQCKETSRNCSSELSWISWCYISHMWSSRNIQLSRESKPHTNTHTLPSFVSSVKTLPRLLAQETYKRGRKGINPYFHKLCLPSHLLPAYKFLTPSFNIKQNAYKIFQSEFNYFKKWIQ